MMFFNELIKRRLATVLQPWVRDNPELEFKLGFFRSNATLNNLTFKTSALNELLDDPSRICFKEVTVEHLSMQIAPCSSAAFTLRVHGLHINLSLGEEEDEEGERWRQRPIDTTVEEKNRVIASIDPEGCALHEAMERISGISPGTWRTSLFNTMLSNIHLQLHDVHVLLQCPGSNGLISCSLYAKELGAGSEFVMSRSFLRGFMSLLFVPSEESPFNVNIDGFEIRVNSGDRTSCVVPSTNMHALIKLKYLRFVSLNFYVPSLKLFFSPADISIMLVFYAFLSRESKRARPGLQLWKIASNKISSLLPTSTSSLLKATKVACLWLRYIRTYQGILQLVGYPVDDAMEKSIILTSGDKTYSRSVKFYWELIFEIEQKLPAELIAMARRIVRSTVASCHSRTNCSSKDSLANIIFLKLHQVFVIIWAVICSLLSFVTRVLSFHKGLPNHSKSSRHFEFACTDSHIQRYFDFNIGEISVSVTPENADQHTIRGKAASDSGFSCQQMLKFHFSVDACFLRYTKNVSRKCFIFACGCWKVLSFSILEESQKSYSKYLVKGRGKKKVNDPQTVIWGEPAKVIYPSEAAGDNIANGSGSTSIRYIDVLIGKLWSSWEEFCSKSEGYIIPTLKSPWMLCEVMSSLRDDGDRSYGFLNCGMVVGRLNFNLEYSSIAAMAAVLRQIQHSLSWDDKSRKRNFVSHTPTTITEDPPRDGSSKHSSYCSEVEMTIMRLLPQKHVQVGVLVASPHVQLSLSEDQFYEENEEPRLIKRATLDIHDIEIVLSPKLDSNLVSSGACLAYNDREPEYPVLKVPEEIDITGSVNEVYSCLGRILYNAHLKFNGAKAYLEESSEHQKHHILEISPMTISLQGLRKEHHSFCSTMTALSIASHWTATGFTTLIFMDELSILTKVISGLYYELSRAFGMLASGDINHQVVPKQETFNADSENETSLARGWMSPIITRVQTAINNTCELKSFGIVIHNSRKGYSMENSSSGTGTKSSTHEMPGHGIYISGPKLFVDVSFRGGNMDLIIDLSGFRSIVFTRPAKNEESLDKSEITNLLCSLNFLIEASVPHIKLCFFLRTFKRSLPHASLSTAIDEPNNGTALHSADHSPWVMNTELLAGHPVLATIAISEIYVSSCPVKDILTRAHKPNKLNASFSVGEEFRTICCDFKGGFLLLEVQSATIFTECCTSYYNRMLNIWPTGSPPGDVVLRHSEDKSDQDVSSMNLRQDQHVTQDHSEGFSLNFSHLCLILVSHDESGKLLELLIEVDFHLNQKVTSTVKKISVGISNFSMLSQCIHMTGQKPRDIQIHGFSSKTHLDSSPDLISEGSSVLEQNDTIHSILTDTGNASPSTSQNDIHTGSSGGSVASVIEQKNVQLTFQNYILKEFQSFFAAEWAMLGDQNQPHKLWVGSGSISGFDMTISLTEIKIMISAFGSFSEVFTRENTSKVEHSHWSSNQDSEESAEELVADGTIVAIQDVDQHMYIAVEDVESSYGVVGVNHYSLVGERSLFRVKYYNARWWKSQVQYFSLISLYAKDNSGESLRLNCRPRQGSVDISCSNDSGCALWAALPIRPDHYGDGVEPESFHPLVRRTFHLVNKKNDYAVAFIDGVLEFVSKPGNLFKWKVFPDPSPASNSLLPSLYSGTASGTNLQFDSNANDTKDLSENGNLSGITITIDKVTLTILHELSDTKEKFPLLQGSITSTETILQISNTKVRVMNTSGVVLNYFDAHQSIWREFLHPLEVCSFFSSKFLISGSDVFHRVKSHFHARIKELIVSLNELSMDIILFVIGKLNVAGPYAVRSSSVLANCCKVENQTGLMLLCQFYDNQEASVPSRRSTTIFLRHLALANQHPEASLFSIKLSQRGFLSTSPIDLSLLEAQKFAWRTRIVSSQDSKYFPGPLIVIQISRGIEDGLSISVSPLLKIHNETDFPLELRFQRPQYKETDSATMMLKAGDVLDDSMAAFGATNLSGGLRKALTSLSVGNFILTFRPDIASSVTNVKNETVEWSDEMKGGKPVSLSGVFDKFSYRVRKAFSVESEKFSLSTAHCAFKSEGGHISEIHFLIQSVRKDVPVIHPDNSGYSPANKNLPVALQEQKEIFLLPTVHVSNLLQTEIHVNLTDGDPLAIMDRNDPWSCATIPSGSAVNLYANPATIDFTVTLTYFGSSCKPVNSKDWVRKLHKKKGDVHHLDIELEFGSGKYFAILRLSLGHNGILEASIFTTYTVENDTDTPLLCFSANQKPLLRSEVEMASNMPPDLGLYLPPKSIKSWFIKHHKVRLKLLEERASEAQLDLDALSGLTEIDLEVEENLGLKNIMRLGVSLRPSVSKVVSTQIVSLSPRYIVSNESEETITIRQCYLEDDMEGLIAINSKERMALRLKSGIGRKRETNAINIFLRKHTKPQDDTLLFIQFRPSEGGLGWSGPVCVASLGRFYLKFRRSAEYFEGQSGSMSHKHNLYEFAAVNVVEGGSTIILHFQRCPTTNLPYRIENYLRHAPITYYQKGSSEPDILGAGHSVDYVWDDLTLPHKLVVQLDDLNMLCEINLDKMRAWKPLYRTKQSRGLGFQSPEDKKPQDQKRTTYSKLIGTETIKLGYEVYADGVTRVLRICEFSDSHKVGAMFHTGTKMRLRIPYFAIHLLEHAKQEVYLGEPSNHAPIITTRLDSINWDSILTDRHKYNQIRIKSLSVDEKWPGAPFASMLRRHQSENSDSNDCILRVTIVLVSSSSRIKQVKYLSIVLQPLDLNLDEETLMKIVPFWRTSLSDSNTPSQQYYFDHFEIHPIKVVGSFLPGDSYSSYSSTQETLRSLIHSVIKVPAIKNMTVELNGVLVTHALITFLELAIKCAQHYSWYAMRSIYIAKGSPLLPPSFTSIFDDLASSSLDVFFDPSSRLPNLPGVTIGTLKLISKFINDKGFSGTKRYFGDLGKTVKTAGSNILFAAVTEVSDSVLKGAEANGFQGMATGFRHGILKLAMEPSVLSSAFMEGGPDRKIKLDRSPGIDELYIEGYLQAMLDAIYKQEYLRVRVIENQVILKNLPPNSALIEEITERVKSFLESQALLKGQSSKVSRSLRHIRGESEWRIGPTVLTLCEHLFVSFAIRILRKQAGKVIASIKWKEKLKVDDDKAIVPSSSGEEQKIKIVWKWGIGKFVLSGIVAYIDGRLCRNIPNPVARRIVSGFLLSFLDKNDE